MTKSGRTPNDVLRTSARTNWGDVTKVVRLQRKDGRMREGQRRVKHC